MTAASWPDDDRSSRTKRNEAWPIAARSDLGGRVGLFVELAESDLVTSQQCVESLEIVSDCIGDWCVWHVTENGPQERVVKIGWEQWHGPVPGSETTSGGPVVVDAHLYGAVGGAMAALLMRIRVKSAAPI